MSSVGHKGKFGHEFLEFEVRPDGLLRYANNSNYKRDTMIRKEGRTHTRTDARTDERREDRPSRPRCSLFTRLRSSFVGGYSVACWSCPVYLSPTTLSALKSIVVDSDILKEDDSQWPAPDSDGRQELEVVVGADHISFVTTKIGSLADVEGSKDAEGLKGFYFLIQDIRAMIFSLISLHWKIKPI